MAKTIDSRNFLPSGPKERHPVNTASEPASEVDRVTIRNRFSEPPAKRIGIAASQKNVTRSILHWHRHQVAYWSGDSMPEDIIFNQLPYWPGDSRPNDIIFNQLHHLRSAFFHCNIVTRSISLTRSIWYAG
jgi:hypothetical protein